MIHFTSMSHARWFVTVVQLDLDTLREARHDDDKAARKGGYFRDRDYRKWSESVKDVEYGLRDLLDEAWTFIDVHRAPALAERYLQPRHAPVAT